MKLIKINVDVTLSENECLERIKEELGNNYYYKGNILELAHTLYKEKCVVFKVTYKY